MKIYQIAARPPSNNQLINKIVVQLLFMITGRPHNYSLISESLRTLKESKDLNIGQQIMTRMEDSLNDQHTIWFKLPEQEKIDLKSRFRSELLQAMKNVNY